MFREVLLKLTEACPCSCSFCDAHEKYLNTCEDELTDANWLQVCEDLVKSNIEVAILSGGEALIRRSLVNNMISYLRAHGIFVVLNTSGAMLNSENDIISLIENYPDLVVFSVDSILAEKHDDNRNFPGLFDRICNAIKLIKYNSGYPVAIRTVITKKNYSEIPLIIRYFNKLGVDCIKFTHIEDDYTGEYLLSESDLDYFEHEIKPKILAELSSCRFDASFLYKEACQKVNRLFQRPGTSFHEYAKSHFAPTMTGNTQCNLIDRFITIQANGVYLPCCESEHHWWPVLGNVSDRRISDLISSKEFVTLSNSRPSYCQRCTEWDNFQLEFTTTCRKVVER